MVKHIRALGVALVFATLPVAVGVGVSAAGGSDHAPVLVPTQSDTHKVTHPCLDGIGTCQLVVTTTVPAHYVFAGNLSNAAIMQASACYYTKYYVWPSMVANDYTVAGSLATSIKLSAENWYDNCTAGLVWISTSCYATQNLGFACLGGWSRGGFWDGGNGYYQDWYNQDTSALWGNVTVSWYLRLHVYASGIWSRWCYNTGAGSC